MIATKQTRKNKKLDSEHNIENAVILTENRNLCLPHLHSTPPPRYGGPRRNIAIRFDVQKN